MTSVTVVDSGVVNLRNITRALEHVGGHVRIDKDPASVLQADRIVLPGVGAFASGMAELRTHHLDSAVKEAAQAGTPILGICLGMQLLFDYSEEDGRCSGLGLIAGGVVPVPSRRPGRQWLGRAAGHAGATRELRGLLRAAGGRRDRRLP